MTSCDIHPFVALLVILASLLCVAQASPVSAAPPSDGSTAEPEITYHAYTTDNATYSTLEQIMQEIAASEGGEEDPEENSHRIDKRYV